MPYVFGADITFKGDGKYAVDPMGLCDSIEEAVRGNHGLHSSFGYYIYEVESTVTHGLTRCFGLRAGTPCSGYKVVGLACHAFEHEAWESRVCGPHANAETYATLADMTIDALKQTIKAEGFC